MIIHTLGGEPVTIEEYLRRLRDGTEPEPTPELEAEAWAREYAPEGATEKEIAELAIRRIPHQVRISALAKAFAESFRVHGPDGMWRGDDKRFPKDRPGRLGAPCPSPRPETGSVPAESVSAGACA